MSRCLGVNTKSTGDAVEWLIDEIKVPSRLRKYMGDIAALSQSIKAVGLLHPVVVDKDNNLIAGARRLEAVKLLGWKKWQ